MEGWKSHGLEQKSRENDTNNHEAAREARAKVIAAEGEHKASRALRHAAEIIMDNPAALQVIDSFEQVLDIL